MSGLATGLALIGCVFIGCIINSLFGTGGIGTGIAAGLAYGLGLYIGANNPGT